MPGLKIFEVQDGRLDCNVKQTMKFHWFGFKFHIVKPLKKLLPESPCSIEEY